MTGKKAMVVQSDKTLLLDTHHPDFDEVRKQIIGFSELVKTPEHLHFYRITPISLWNAAANGMPLESILAILEQYKKYDIPKNIVEYVKRHYLAYGQVILEKDGEENLRLRINNPKITEKVEKFTADYAKKDDDGSFVFEKKYRGELKATLIRHLIPVHDIAGYESGNSLDITLRAVTLGNQRFALRYYQSEGVYSFSKWREGSGVIVLPCGAGKTVVGIGIMQDIKEYTLIITTSVDSVRQWIREIMDKTTLTEDQIGEYTGDKKSIRPITITTYNMLIYRKNSEGGFRNMDIFSRQNWGLIIYDEVHFLPAPIFRMTTAIQSKRRLGLTATLVREDNLETEVFTLIGPKVYEYPWKTLEKEGWIAEAFCYEIRIPLTSEGYEFYKNANNRTKFRIASENPNKVDMIDMLIKRYKNHHILIIGHYLTQLREIAELFDLPLITGSTPNNERTEIYDAFRAGKISALVISKVGNFSIDLPDADVAIQISGVFGSRQEEAQRLGRILRPDSGKSYFYALVSKDTLEEDFSRKRQMFLLEQGYKYTIVDYSNKQENGELSMPLVLSETGE
ncbi:MAG: DEAD/DEAH box helicase family protein [Brevinematales bacterium]|nr:DEAD/DEAH box helicase family protein [Brevinematales bacterium]